MWVKRKKIWQRWNWQYHLSKRFTILNEYICMYVNKLVTHGVRRLYVHVIINKEIFIFFYLRQVTLTGTHLNCPHVLYNSGFGPQPAGFVSLTLILETCGRRKNIWLYKWRSKEDTFFLSRRKTLFLTSSLD